MRKTLIPKGLIVTMVGCLLYTASEADTNSQALPIFPAAVKGDRCVEPVAVMRREHMIILFNQRDRTVYQGERSTKHSLVGCLSCHTSKDSTGEYIPINATGQFCQSCHEYASVKIDCFECHAAKPAN